MKSVSILAFLSFLAASPLSGAEWKTFENCRLDKRDYRDGDSFHVRNEKGREYVFRLYFVDCPETDDRFPDRIQEQGDYFGGLAKADVIRLGKEAAAFTDDFLKGTFTVHTRYDDARGAGDRKRNYAILEKDRVSLAEALVEKGFARIHGVDVTPPGAGSEKAYLLRLKGKENEARKAGAGGWAAAHRREGKGAGARRPASWEVREGEARTRTAAVLLADKAPQGVVAYVPAGGTVQVLGAGATPDKVRVRVEIDGVPREGVVERTALEW